MPPVVALGRALVTTPQNPFGSDDSQGGAQGNPQDQTQDFTRDFTQGYPQDSFQQDPQNLYGQPDQYNSAPYGEPAGAPYGMAAYPNAQQANMTTGADKDGFFAALFDFSFTRYVTPSVVKVLYTLLMVVIGLFVLLAVIGLIVAMSQDGSSAVAAIIFLPLVILGAIAWLAFYRVGLEVAVSIIRTAQSVQSIDERQARNSSFGG